MRFPFAITAIVTLVTAEAAVRAPRALHQRDGSLGSHNHKEKRYCHSRGVSSSTPTVSVSAYEPTYVSSTTATTTTSLSESQATTSTTSSTASSTSDTNNFSSCQTLLVPKETRPAEPWIFTGGYYGTGVRTYTDPAYPLPVQYFDGSQPVCTAAQQCGYQAIYSDPARDYSDFELHKQISTNQWVCILWPYHYSAVNFTVADSDVGAAFEWALL